MKAALVLMALFAAACLSEVLLSDDFEDGDAEGWMELPWGTYEVLDGWYTLSHSDPDTAMAASLNADGPNGMSVPDYSCLFKGKLMEGTAMIVGLRIDATMEHGYSLFVYPANMIALLRADGVGQGEVLEWIEYVIDYDQEYWMRLEIKGDMIGAKLWTGSSADEPDEWMLEATDGSYTSPGYVVLSAFMFDSPASVEVAFDEVVVTDETTLDFDASTWAGIKAAH